MLDAEPLVPGAAPSGLHFVRDEDAAVAVDDLGDDLEVLLRRHDEAADAEDRLGDHAGDLAVRRREDQVFDVGRAADAALRIRLAERAAVAVRRVGVLDAGDRGPAVAPRRVTGRGHRAHGAAVIRVPQRDDLLAPGVEARREDRGRTRFGATVAGVALVAV